jgi:hypothetical protein
MLNTMSENDWRGKMLAWKKDRSVLDGMELIDVMIADMEREKVEAAEQKKNTRPARRMYLRAYLKLLTQSIAHNVSKKKGVAQDAP